MPNQPMTTINYEALQFVGAHNSTACTSLQTITLPDGANSLLIQARGQNINIKFDGVSPTASSGFILYTSQLPVLLVLPDSKRSFLAIQEAASGILEWQGVAQ